jgi:N-acetylneuraminic acid mutarotase
MTRSNASARIETMESRLLMCSDPAHAAALSSSPIVREAAATADPALFANAVAAGTPAVLRVDAGGSTSFNDAAGNAWGKDAGFVGGNANTATFAVAGTTDDALYATRRAGNFRYANAVPSGTYKLRLLFSDHLTTAGSRKFNVTVEGRQVLTNFDIVANGGGRAALVREFAVTVTDGRLDMAFASVVRNATLSAFELVAATTTPGATGAWGQASPAPLAVYESQGSAVGGRMLLFGGFHNKPIQTTRASYAYDAAANRWSRIADLPTNLTHAGVVADGNRAWIVGGLVGEYPNNPPTRDVWIYNATTNSYSRGPSLPTARGAGALVKLGRTLHYFGGYKPGFTDSSDHYVLNLDGGTAWRTAAPLPNARNHLGGAALNGKVYAIGGQHGRNEDTGNQASVHVYDPATNAWKAVKSLPTARSHLGSSTVVVNGSIWVISGITQGRQTLRDVTRYDPGSNAWTQIQALPSARKAPVAALLGTRLFVATGASSAGVPQSTNYVRTV